MYLARDSPGRIEKSVAPEVATAGAASSTRTGLAEGAPGSAAGAAPSKRGGREASEEAYLESGNPRPRPRRRRERRPRSPPRSGRSPRSVRSVFGAAPDSVSAAAAAARGASVSAASIASGGASGSGGRFRLSRPGSRFTETRSKSSVSSAKSDTYRKVSRSRPRSTKADCMPGKTRVTRPLWMLPASEYSLARWKNTSTSWSSSRIPTLISWRFAAITNSLLMNAPTIHGEKPELRKREGEPVSPLPRVIHRTVCPAHANFKIFQPPKAENQISYALPTGDRPLRRSTKAGKLRATANRRPTLPEEALNPTAGLD